VYIRTTQFSILAKLKEEGRPLTINRFAEVIVMDRTTLGRNILPLQRDGRIAVTQGTVDRRSKELYLTDVGLKRLLEAWTYWGKAGWIRSRLRQLQRFEIANADASRDVNRACDGATKHR
jgi:DNA-binding MarR family transcriptional regulator